MTDFQAVDTTVVQVRSVLNFMYALGYTLDTTSKTGRFVTEQKAHQGIRYISANTAVRMHNLPVEKWDLYENGVAVPSNLNFQVGFTAIGVQLAVASKLVEKAKFVVTRYGQAIVRDVMVKPLNNTVLSLIEPAQ